MKSFFTSTIVLCYLFFIFSLAATEQKLPRTIIGLYDGVSYEDTSRSFLYKFAEKSLNHLGIKIDYYDIHQGLPNLDQIEDVIGVITWFFDGHKGIDAEESLAWSKEAVAKGLKYVVIGEAIFRLDKDDPLPLQSINSFWHLLGMEEGGWIADNYMATAEDLDESIMNFERESRYINKPYTVMKAISSEVTTHATAAYKKDSSRNSQLIMTSSKGAYINGNYALFNYASDLTGANSYWCVNPFELFRKIFDTDALPKPDISTEAGRRIYYSHIDGDGWNNAPQLTRYKSDKPKISAETVYREILAPFPDMPCSCGAIGADLSEKWVGTEESRRIAKQIFSLPQVEVASHTLSHPFHWFFYQDYLPQDEIAYLQQYAHHGWAGNQRYEDTYHKATENIRKKELKEGYKAPRGFADHPFSLQDEVQGSLDIVNEVSPQEKKAKIYLWSGDCVPFEEAIKATREAGVKNMNGGDARFDFIASSYVWIPPIGRRVNDQLQIHCSGSNENIYTNLWRSKFWAFSTVPFTYINSEFPIRVIPINLYYHIYCAEKEPALASLIKNLHFAEKQEICPIFASTFAAIAEGFYSTEFYKLGKNKWKVTNRGELNTVRFDRSSLVSVDFEHSDGVIGQKHYQGSLYVYLDNAVKEAMISLKDNKITEREPIENCYYLISSRWRVWGTSQSDNEIQLKSMGIGKGEMVWSVPEPGTYRVEVVDGSHHESNEYITQSNLLEFGLKSAENREVTIKIIRT